MPQDTTHTIGTDTPQHAGETSPLWHKSTTMTEEIARFTIGRDRELDLLLADCDVLGSIAHTAMLTEIGMLTPAERDMLHTHLRHILTEIRQGRFAIADGVEDVHSQVELMLTRRLGDVGKKIHSGRSRNDQVALDIKLWTRHQLAATIRLVRQLFDTLQRQSEHYRHVLMPGYTHLQVAMPSSFGLWFGAYAEALADDMAMLTTAYRINDRNPLGSAAGYGSSFPLRRQRTTELLGFDTMAYNVVYAQMGRGKTERSVSSAIAAVAYTLSRLAFDACMYNSQNFAFIKLPDECTTGSSIMPHKKNPDVFELTRAKCNKLQALQAQVTLITNNLPSGYFRDMQVLKEVVMPAFSELHDCLRMTIYIIERVRVNEHILDDARYDNMFSVETVNRLAAEGVPFRDAYRRVGLDIENGTFKPEKQLHHTHEGSIGNLCNEQIRQRMDREMAAIDLTRAEEAEQRLAEG